MVWSTAGHDFCKLATVGWRGGRTFNATSTPLQVMAVLTHQTTSSLEVVKVAKVARASLAELEHYCTFPKTPPDSALLLGDTLY